VSLGPINRIGSPLYPSKDSSLVWTKLEVKRIDFPFIQLRTFLMEFSRKSDVGGERGRRGRGRGRGRGIREGERVVNKGAVGWEREEKEKEKIFHFPLYFLIWRIYSFFPICWIPLSPHPVYVHWICLFGMRFYFQVFFNIFR
jgi:hypothetical protein